MIVRVCVGIPVYDNPDTIVGVVAKALSCTDFPILVVDDGSKIPVEELLGAQTITAAAIKAGRLHVFRANENRGKGAAIQIALSYAVAQGFTHLLTLDADGQHPPAEIEKLVRATYEDPWALVIGKRKMEAAEAPKASRFGRCFSNFWVEYETGKAAADSQSGFRVYPLFFCQSLKFWTRRFDFEIEVLIRLMWKGVSVREVPVDVVYFPKGSRVTHFHKFWDNVRISLLNTCLVAIALLQSHLRPRDVALAIGIGVWIGCTPFFGFQTLLAIAVALLFRLNAPLLILGTQIASPPMVPLLAVLNIKAGALLSQDLFGSLGGLVRHGAEWLLGSFIVGPGLGAMFGALGFWIAKQHQRRKQRQRGWSGKTRGGFGNRILKFVLKKFGLSAAYTCLFAIVPYFYLFAPGARRGSSEYWRKLEPSASWVRRQFLIMRHFHRFGMLLLDRLYQSYFESPRFVTTPNGMQNMNDALKEGKGLILLGAHLGAWDLAARLIRDDGLKESLYSVQYVANGVTFNQLKASHEKANADIPIASNQAAQPILKIHSLLKDGKVLAFLGDRPLGRSFDLVPFLGGLAAFDTTPFRIAAATATPLLFTFGFRAGRRSYQFFATPAKRYAYSTEARERQVYDWVCDYVRVVESFVRKYPDQWNNFYPFFSTRVASIDVAVKETTKAEKDRNPMERGIPVIPTYRPESEYR